MTPTRGSDTHGPWSWPIAAARALCLAAMLAFAAGGCSVRNLAANSLGDALAASSSGFAEDEDPDLIGAAAPFSLKLMEGVLAETPRHRGLLLAAARAFVQYAYAYVEQRADELEDSDLQAAHAQRDRARRLYLRARSYGLRGLETTYPGWSTALQADPAAAAARLQADDLALAYWTAVASAAAIALAKDDPFLVAELPAVEALLRRVLALDEGFDHGAAHVFMIGFEMSRAALTAGAPGRARRHFARAVELSAGSHAGPYVTLAEAVSIPERNRAEFETVLQHALRIDAGARPEWRLANSVLQRRARWLLARAHEHFPDSPFSERTP